MNPQIQNDILEQMLTNLKGKHIKSTLTRLEKIEANSQQVRKIILDEFNDFLRDTLRVLGYEVAD